MGKQYPSKGGIGLAGLAPNVKKLWAAACWIAWFTIGFAVSPTPKDLHSMLVHKKWPEIAGLKVVPAYCLAVSQCVSAGVLWSAGPWSGDLGRFILQACLVSGPCSWLAASQGVLSASRGHPYSYHVARFTWNASGTYLVLGSLSPMTLLCCCLGISNQRLPSLKLACLTPPRLQVHWVDAHATCPVLFPEADISSITTNRNPRGDSDTLPRGIKPRLLCGSSPPREICYQCSLCSCLHQ